MTPFTRLRHSMLIGAAVLLSCVPGLRAAPPAPTTVPDGGAPAAAGPNLAAPTTTAADQAALGRACDEAAGMPADAVVATPDVSLLGAPDAHRDPPHLQAVVDACTRAAQADPKQGRYLHRLGIALASLKRPGEAKAAFEQAMALNYPGGFDELADADFQGSLAPALPKDPAKGIAIAEKGIAATNNPEIKRDLANFLLTAEPPLGDKTRARALLEQAAAQGHGPAMADLAGNLAAGSNGFASDPARARTLLDTAVAAGSRTAAYQLAELLDNGTGLPADAKAARALYGKAAAGGSGAGMTAVADMMTKGDGGPKDVEGARKWLARRAGRGDIDGRHQLANSLLHNDPKNTDVGLTMMVDAAGAGDVSAAYALGEIFKDGIDVQRDSRRALEWYHKAADAGEPKALERIGSMYDYGQGVGVDHAEARRYYDRAAAQGVGAALHDIGMQIDHGMGVRADPVAALGWYRKAAAMNVPASISNLGFAYENGRGVRKNLAEAVHWYTKAAELDDATAEHNLGSLYMDGTGVARDKLTGLSLLRKAALHGHAMSLNDLALYEMKEPRPDGAGAVDMLRRAAADKLPNAYLNLAQALADGWDGRQDFVEANYWYGQAVAARSDLQPIVRSESQFHLGENMVLGRGIKRDVRRGRALIAAAAKAGNPTARAYLKGSKVAQSYRR